MSDTAETVASPPKSRAPWPIRILKVVAVIAFLLILLSVLILLSSVLEIDPEKGLSCNEAVSGFSQMRHSVLCGYLQYHFPAYLLGTQDHLQVIPQEKLWGLISQIAVDLLESDLLYIMMFLLAVFSRRIWLYAACAIVISVYGINHVSITYSVIGIAALLSLLHRPTRAWLLPADRPVKVKQ